MESNHMKAGETFRNNRIFSVIPLALLVSALFGCNTFRNESPGDGRVFEIVEHYQKGELKSRCSYIQLGRDPAVRHGICTEWYPGGNKKSEKTYRYGKKHGKEVGWYEWGEFCFLVTWNNGVAIERVSFHPEGRIACQSARGECGLDYSREYNEDGNMILLNAGAVGNDETRMTFFYKEGGVLDSMMVFPGSEQLYINFYNATTIAKMDLHGMEIYFYPDGRIKAEFSYADEKSEFSCKGVWYDAEGNVVASGRYVNDQKWDGVFIEMDCKPPFEFLRMFEYREGVLVQTKELANQREEDSGMPQD